MAIDDACAVVARLIGQDNTEGLVISLEDCVAAVRRDEEADASSSDPPAGPVL